MAGAVTRMASRFAQLTHAQKKPRAVPGPAHPKLRKQQFVAHWRHFSVASLVVFACPAGANYYSSDH
jgi:hypothetical protein